MKTRIQQLGDGVALVIPPEVAAEPAFAANAEVEVTLEHGALVVRPISRRRPTPDELLARMTDAHLHSEVDLGPPVGKELL